MALPIISIGVTVPDEEGYQAIEHMTHRSVRRTLTFFDNDPCRNEPVTLDDAFETVMHEVGTNNEVILLVAGICNRPMLLIELTEVFRLCSIKAIAYVIQKKEEG